MSNIKELVKAYQMVGDGNKERMLEMALHDLWRNHPEWPSTFGPCHNPECGEMGRGSGLCKTCVTACIAEITGKPELAEEMRNAIAITREVAGKLRDSVAPDRE